MKSLNKRIIRELKAHFGRYLALLFIIVLGMYLVVSVAGMAETTIAGTEKYNERCRLQDGQFTVFVPLTDGQLKDLSDKHGDIESIFSVDVSVRSGDSGPEKTLRIFKVRKDIDLLNIDEGTLPEKDDEIVIMNLFAERNELKAGDSIRLSGKDYRISGIGCVPDYNLTVKNFSDMTADPVSFGVALVSDTAYEEIKKGGDAGVEDYTYAYRFRNSELLSSKEKETRARELKDDIKDIDFDYRASGNDYLIEYVDRMYQDKTDFEEALDELVDGTDELYDGINEVYDGSSELNNGAAEFYNAVEENNKSFALLQATPYSALTQITDGYLEGAEDLKDGAEELTDGI